MKITLCCTSPLLQSSLEFFLKDYCVDESISDFIITDDPQNLQSSKPLCIVSDGEDSHIRKPFSAQSLREDLQIFYEEMQSQILSQASLGIPSSLDSVGFVEEITSFKPPMDEPSYPHSSTSSLEAQIASLAQEFAKKVIKLVQENQK